MSVQVIDTDKLNKIEKDITDYLFERHHSINRALVMDLAYWVYGYGDRQRLNAQLDTVGTQTVTTFTGPTKKPKPKGQ